MIINVDFYLGQTCYFVWRDKIQKGTVEQINAYLNNSGLRVIYEVELKDKTMLSTSSIFETPEEAAQKLIKEAK